MLSHLLAWIKRIVAQTRPKPLNEWFHVTFDEDRVYIRAEPPGRAPWTDEFAWSTVERVCFEATDFLESDGIYVYTSRGSEGHAIPTEAEGGSELWDEIIRRGLFDIDLAIEAMKSPGGLFVWPADEATGKTKFP